MSKLWATECLEQWASYLEQMQQVNDLETLSQLNQELSRHFKAAVDPQGQSDDAQMTRYLYRQLIMGFDRIDNNLSILSRTFQPERQVPYWQELQVNLVIVLRQIRELYSQDGYQNEFLARDNVDLELVQRLLLAPSS